MDQLVAIQDQEERHYHRGFLLDSLLSLNNNDDDVHVFDDGDDDMDQQQQQHQHRRRRRRSQSIRRRSQSMTTTTKTTSHEDDMKDDDDDEEDKVEDRSVNMNPTSYSSRSPPFDLQLYLEWRSTMIRWNLNIAETCKFQLSTIEIATSLLDQYVAILTMSVTKASPAFDDIDVDVDDDDVEDWKPDWKPTTTRRSKNNHGDPIATDARRFQLACMSCLYIAAKVHEDHCLTPNQLETISSGRFEAHEIVSMEMDILKILKWNVNPPTASTTARLILSILFQQREEQPQVQKQHGRKKRPSHFPPFCFYDDIIQLAEAHIELAMVTESIIPLDTFSVAVACLNMALRCYGVVTTTVDYPSPSSSSSNTILKTKPHHQVRQSLIQKELYRVLYWSLGGGGTPSAAIPASYCCNERLVSSTTSTPTPTKVTVEWRNPIPLNPLLTEVYRQQQQKRQQLQVHQSSKSTATTTTSSNGSIRVDKGTTTTASTDNDNSNHSKKKNDRRKNRCNSGPQQPKKQLEQQYSSPRSVLVISSPPSSSGDTTTTSTGPAGPAC